MKLLILCYDLKIRLNVVNITTMIADTRAEHGLEDLRVTNVHDVVTSAL